MFVDFKTSNLASNELLRLLENILLQRPSSLYYSKDIISTNLNLIELASQHLYVTHVKGWMAHCLYPGVLQGT